MHLSSNIFSYHAVYDQSVYDALAFAHEYGFGGIQIADESPHLSHERITDADSEQIADLRRKLGLRIGLHAPDYAASLLQYSPQLRHGIREYYRSLLCFARQIQASIVTIHLGAMTTFPTDTVPELKVPPMDERLYREAFTEAVGRLLECERGPARICVETYGLDQLGCELLQPYLDQEQLFLCWDLAKSFVDPAMEEFALRNLQHVRQVHLHDVCEGKEKRLRGHRKVGTGRIDLHRYFTHLMKSPVEDICIEVRPREQALASLEYVTTWSEAEPCVGNAGKRG